MTSQELIKSINKKYSHNYFPNDQKKYIDYVIYYKTTPETKQEAKKMREKFKRQLKDKEKFEIEEVLIKGSNVEESAFLLLNCPLERLMTEAENMNLCIPLKNVSRYFFIMPFLKLLIFSSI